jgi:hypothetical protein
MHLIFTVRWEAIMLGFRNFEDALAALPDFIGGIDLLGQHRCISDLMFRVQHEMDLFTEGEPSEISVEGSPRKTINRYRACRDYCARCRASYEEEK